jgi:hypothetical protein
MSASPPDLSCLVVNWNTRQALLELLRSISAAVGSLTTERVVIDNASSDDSVAAVRAAFPEVAVIESPENLGYTGATNRGLAASSAPFVLLLNADVRLLSGAVEEAAAYLSAHPDVGAVGLALRDPDGCHQASHARFPTLRSELLIATGLGRRLLNPYFPGEREPQRTEPREVDWITGCLMLIRREAIDEVGGMDESFWMYSEDTDWCYRLRQGGWRIVHLPSVRAIHEGGASTRQMPVEMAAQLNRGKLRFFAKHYGTGRTTALRLLLGAVYVARAVVYRICGALSGPGRRAFWTTAAETATAVANVYRRGLRSEAPEPVWRPE